MELSIDRLTKQYGRKIAVDCVSATLKPGVYGLLGANGAGKTTLMRMLCAILESTSGEVLLDGKEVTSMGADYRNVLGYLPQDFGYYPNYTAMEFLMYIAALKGIPKNVAKKHAEELLEVVDLSHVANKKVKTFSGGMKQRVGIAQALLNHPKILILDEPTAGLDPKERVRFRNLISEYLVVEGDSYEGHFNEKMLFGMSIPEEIRSKNEDAQAAYHEDVDQVNGAKLTIEVTFLDDSTEIHHYRLNTGKIFVPSDENGYLQWDNLTRFIISEDEPYTYGYLMEKID